MSGLKARGPHHTSRLPGRARNSAGALGTQHIFSLRVLPHRTIGTARSVPQEENALGTQVRTAWNEDGFSIVELLITLIVIGVAFGAFMVTFTTIQNINKKALDINKANTLAFAKVQEYENKQFTSLPATSPTGTLQQVEDFSASLPTVFESPRVGRVYVNTVSSTLKQVVVNIEFGSGAGKRVVQYANFIQRNGLGR